MKGQTWMGLVLQCIFIFLRRLMMSRKQLFFLSLCFVLIAGIVWGGGSQSNTGQAAARGGPMTITWAGYQLVPVGDNPYMIKKWNEQFNIDIQIWNIDQANYFEILNLKFAANEIPDFFRTDLSRLPQQVQQQIPAEIPENVITTNIPRIYKEFNDLYPGFLKLTTINNKIYAIINEMDRPYRDGIVYRGDWIKNLGKQGTPKALAEFEELIYQFTNNDPDRNGRKDTYGLSVSAFKPVYGAFGYVRNQWNDKNGQLVYSSIQPEMKDALAYLAKWYKDGVIDPEFVTGENKGGYWAVSHAFTEGRIGVSSHASFYHWDAPDNNRANINEMMIHNPVGATSTVFGEPFSGPTGKKGINMRTAMTGIAHAFGKQIEKDRDKMEKILQMQEYLCSTPELYLTAQLGIRGEDWDYDTGIIASCMRRARR